MFIHIKKLWGHYVMLVIAIVALVFPIHWINKIVQEYMGDEPALLAITVTVILIIIFGVNGAVYTHKILLLLREELSEQESQLPSGNTEIPFVLRIFSIENCWPQGSSSGPGNETKNDSDMCDYLMPLPGRRRGKQPRFQEEKIHKAVLKWEKRDPSFSARTLEEFLEQEFGSGPDGILLMAPTTFYDWRRRVLKELEGHANRR